MIGIAAQSVGLQSRNHCMMIHSMTVQRTHQHTEKRA